MGLFNKSGKKEGKSVMDCVKEFIDLNQTAKSVEEYKEKLTLLLHTKTSCPVCSADFIFDDTLKCNNIDRSYEFFCPECKMRFTGIKTRPQPQ